MPDHVHRRLSIGSKLKYGIMLSCLILVLEVIGGLLSHSLALLSDAGHVLADILALSLSWYGVKQAERPATSRMTFGYHRIGVIIATVNTISIFAIAGAVFYGAYQRWQQPQEINSLLMLAIAVIGMGVNIFVASWLRKEQQTNLNVQSAFWHALGDALASAGVIIGGIVITFTHQLIADPIASVFIGGIIILAAWRILKESLVVFLEATPLHVDVTDMINTLKRLPGVRDVHDVHVWSISPEIHAMSCHVLIDDILISQAGDIRQKIEGILQQHYNIKHTVLQMECQDCGCKDTFCKLTFEPEEEK
jgi:cobalt-zinc-cadmium efflux system protein